MRVCVSVLPWPRTHRPSSSSLETSPLMLATLRLRRLRLLGRCPALADAAKTLSLFAEVGADFSRGCPPRRPARPRFSLLSPSAASSAWPSSSCCGSSFCGLAPIGLDVAGADSGAGAGVRFRAGAGAGSDAVFGESGCVVDM